MKALDFAKENNVLLLSFVPHTTHKMQPLDIGVYMPLKLCFEQAICTLHVASAQNVISGFRSSGIWPYNPHIFSDVDSAPASVAEHSDPEYASDIWNGRSETTSLPGFVPAHLNSDFCFSCSQWLVSHC
ncbi:hypothetical protein PR048_028947 [Dryococelus australis]|uniref:DDE-1 domain-containing protein n=1 Tax=Dryococelus australis TaxID=614101 RepID=A0ABQ9GEI4_9NEOP|nr:hypothetical protein PR048_028947 [Dryococelus australis]